MRKLYSRIKKERRPSLSLLWRNLPIAVGAGEKLLQRLMDEMGVGEEKANNLLKFHTTRIDYLNQIVQSQNRYDVDLNISGEVNAKHREVAAGRIKKITKALAKQKAEIEQAEKSKQEAQPPSDEA
jgi:sRNA-binding protein